MVIQITSLEARRFKNYRELLCFVLEIADQSLEDLLEENSFSKYRELLQCYQSSPRELRGRVKEIQERVFHVIRLLKDRDLEDAKVHVQMALKAFSPRWIQIFANILFIIEPEIINHNSNLVRETWELLFSVMPSEFNPLNINLR